MRIIFSLIVCFILASCVKDTDFSQAEDIELRPDMEVDLIYFNLQGSDFYDPETNTEILTARDTTNLLFLDDDFMKDGLDSVAFYFQFNNSIPRSFDSNFSFYSQEDELFYTLSFTVDAGANGTSTETIYTQTVSGDDLLLLTEASKLVSEMTISSTDENLQGVLNLQSKAAFYLVLN